MLNPDQNIGAYQRKILKNVLEEMKVSPSQIYNDVEALKKALSGENFSDTESWKKRQELCHLLESLLLVDLDFALDKKVEQDLWSFVFRNPISACQSKAKEQQQTDLNYSKNQLTSLLETASGFYLQLLQKLCCAYDIDLPCHPRDSVYGLTKEFIGRHPVVNKPRKSSLLYVCQHCLVHLGDIARYRGQSLQAENFYRHAVDLVPSNGQPYNQLALLEAASGEKLSTVFFHMRSLAVQHPFPVAANNLQTLFSKLPMDGAVTEGKTKMTAFEYITAFLQFHASVHLMIDLHKTEKLVIQLVTCLPALVIAEKFETWQLVQMVAVCLFAIENTWNAENMRSISSIEKALLSFEASKGSSHVEELLANMLYAFLLPLHASPEPKETAMYYTLPAVKIILDWLLQDPKLLQHESLSKKPQLWPALCKLLNDLDAVSVEPYDSEKFEYIPLPEDWDLQCFLPLKESQKNLKFNLNAETPSDEESAWLRAVRLCKLGEILTEEGKEGLNVLSVNYSNGRRHFKAVHQGEAVVEQFLQQIHELTVSTNSVSVVSQPLETTLHTNTNLANEHAVPSLRLKAHSDSVPQQEVRFKLDDIQQRKEKLEAERDEKDRRNKDVSYSNRDRRIGKNVAVQAILQQRAAQTSTNILSRTSEYGKESNLLQPDVTIRQSTRASNLMDASHHVRSNPERNCLTPQTVSEVNVNRNQMSYNSEQYNHISTQQMQSHDSTASLDRGDSWMQSLKLHQTTIPNVSQVLRGNALNNYLQNSLPHIIQPSPSDFTYHQASSQSQQQIQPHTLVNRQMSSPSQAFLPNSPGMLWNYMNFMASCQQARSGNASSANHQILMPMNNEHRSPNNQLHQPSHYIVMNNLQKISNIDSNIQPKMIHPYRNASDDTCMISRSDVYREQMRDQLSCQGQPVTMWNRDTVSSDTIQSSSSPNQVVGRAVGQAVHPNQPIHGGGNNNPTVTSTGQPDVGSNTYSLFNSPWPSGLSVHRTNKENQHSGAVDSILMQSRIQSLWSGPGPSPLERLLEQQKHGRDNATL